MTLYIEVETSKFFEDLDKSIPKFNVLEVDENSIEQTNLDSMHGLIQFTSKSKVDIDNKIINNIRSSRTLLEEFNFNKIINLNDS